MQAPFYLAFGSVVAEDGTGTLPYHITSMQLPEPAEDGLGGFHPAVRVFRVRVSGADTATVTAAVAALRRECVRDNLITLQSASDRAILTTRIRKAAVVEFEFDPLDRPSSGAAKMYLTLTLTTDPHWHAPWSAETTASLTAVPGTFAIADPGGEDDALVSMRAIASATARGLFLGAMPDAATGFDPIDDYGASGAGTADANALTGYKVASSALTATMAAVGTAPAFDTNANRGTYIPIVRMDSTAASVATTAYRVVQRVTGNAISASTDVDTASVTPRAVDLVATELERISVPSGAVPDVDTGSGYTEPALSVSQTAQDADAFLHGGTSSIARVLSLTAGQMLSIVTLKTGATYGFTGAAGIFATSGGVPIGSALKTVSVPAVGKNMEFTVAFDWVAQGTATYAVKLIPSMDSELAYSTTATGQAYSSAASSGAEDAPMVKGIPGASQTLASQGAQSMSYGLPNATQYCGQTAALAKNARIDSLTIRASLQSGLAYPRLRATIRGASSGLPTGIVLGESAVTKDLTTETDVSFPFNAMLKAGSYAFSVYGADGSVILVRRNTSGGYAGGSSYSEAGGFPLSADPTDDLRFSLTGCELVDGDLWIKATTRSPRGFNSYTIIQASDTTASNKIANLDYLVRVPVDYAAIAYRRTTAADAPALFYDGDTDTPYSANATGIGPAVFVECEVIRPLRAKPGVATTYVLATTHAANPVGTATVKYKTRARYLSATG